MKSYYRLGLLFILGLCALSSVSCAANREPRVIGQNDDVTIFEAKCHGTGRTIGDCHSQAASKCPNGYTVQDKSESPVTFSAGGNINTGIHRSLIFVCK
jgi:hypothetical protein